MVKKTPLPEKQTVSDEDSIGSILRRVERSEMVTGLELQSYAYKIHRLSSKAMKVGHIHDMMAHLLGYKSTEAMAAARVITGPGKKDWFVNNKGSNEKRTT